MPRGATVAQDTTGATALPRHRAARRGDRGRLTLPQVLGIVRGRFGVVNHVTWRQRGPQRVIGGSHVGCGKWISVWWRSLGGRGHRVLLRAVDLAFFVVHAGHLQARERLRRIACTRSSRSHAGGRADARARERAHANDRSTAMSTIRKRRARPLNACRLSERLSPMHARPRPPVSTQACNTCTRGNAPDFETMPSFTKARSR